MTVSATTNRQTFSGPYTVPIDFDLKIYDETDLILVVSNDTTGAETPLILDTHYTIEIDDPGPGGTITILDPDDMLAGTTLTVLATLPYTQEIDLEAGGNMPAEVLEEGFDRATILIQQLKELLDRTPKLLKSSTYSNLTYPDPEASKFLAWRTDLKGFTNKAFIPAEGVLTVSTYGESVVAATDASSLQDILEISAYVKTLLNDADASAFLTTLGISTFIKTLLNDATSAAARTTLEIPLDPNHFSGLAMTHAVDTEHDITIAAGKRRDATDTVDIVLPSAITKQFNAPWAVGTDVGGMAAGESLPASGTIHIWLILRSDTKVAEVMANNHATTGLTPTLPANYDYKKLIGSYRTDSSNNILNGDWTGTGNHRTFMYDTPILDIAATNPGTNAVTAALSTPGGIITKVFCNINNSLGGGGIGILYLSSLNNADVAASATAAPLGILGTLTSYYSNMGSLFTNTSSQIRYRTTFSDGDVVVRIATLGYQMFL